MSSGYELTHKKISRNKLLTEVFEDYKKLINIEMKIKQEQYDFYTKQQEQLAYVNSIEEKQSVEFTLERQQEINNIMKNIGLFKESDELIELMGTAQGIKDNVDHNAMIIAQLQDMIPESGVITNYRVGHSSADETCDKSVRDNNCD